MARRGSRCTAGAICKLGETVLVLAAAGGVGSSAVQMAKAHGCRVIAAAGGPDKMQVCRDLGADVAIDYRNEDLYERVMAETDGRGRRRGV